MSDFYPDALTSETKPSVLHGRKLGFLLHLDADLEPAAAYRQAIELFVHAEEVGYDSGWVIQRHFGQGNERISAPLPILAAIAQHTSRIHLGTGVVVLPLEDPIRLAEDAATVDALSGGRLELGVGAGPFTGAWEAFGRDLRHRHAIWEESIARLHEILEGARLNEAGETLYPSGEGVRSRLWQATTSDPEFAIAHAQAAGRAGDGLQLSRATEWNRNQSTHAQAEIIAAYRAALPEGTPPRVLVSRAVYPDADHRVAGEKLAPGARRWQEWHGRLGREEATRVSTAVYLERDRTYFGDPEEITGLLASDLGIIPTTELLVSFVPAVPDLTEHKRLLTDTARRVAEPLGWVPAGRLPIRKTRSRNRAARGARRYA